MQIKGKCMQLVAWPLRAYKEKEKLLAGLAMNRPGAQKEKTWLDQWATNVQIKYKHVEMAIGV
jgi:hypothetical protein